LVSGASLRFDDSGSNYLGTSMSAAGDADGNGYNDLAIGAPGSWATTTNKAYVVRGGPDLPANGTYVLQTAPEVDIYLNISGWSGSAFGWSVVGGRDVDLDGYADILVGAPKYTSSTIGGAVALISAPNPAQSSTVAINVASPTVPVKYARRSITACNDCRFGLSAAMGRFEGAVKTDVITGAYQYSSNTGVAYLESDLADNAASWTYLDTDATYTFAGSASYETGRKCANAGDINNDGYDDFVIVETGAASYLGDVRVLFGGPSPITETLISNDIADTQWLGWGLGTSVSAGQNISP
jgi:hypothetical protein